MNRKSFAALSVLVCGIGLLVLRSTAPADEPRPSAADREFKFKDHGVLLLDIVKGSGLAGHDSQFISEAKLVKIGDRFFVRGKGFVANDYADDPKWKWYQGCDVAYAWDTVANFSDLTTDQVEQYVASSKE